MVMGHGLDDCTLWYVDDILVASDTFEDHVKDLKRVFIRLKEFGVTLNLDKTRLFKNSAPFLGHVLVPGGVIPQQEKINSIKDWKIPSNKKELKTFLWFISYYRKFIPNFSAMMATFYQLIKQQVTWKWGIEMTTHFDKCKDLFRNYMLLLNPDLKISRCMWTVVGMVWVPHWYKLTRPSRSG